MTRLPALGPRGEGWMAIHFELKSRREEAWLMERVPSYADYRAKTRRLIPWIG